MITVEVKGADQLARKFQNFQKQVAFAASKAINDTAVDVQKYELEKQLPSKLTLRSRGSPWTKPGTKFGINIKPFATKTNLLATVGSQADWLKLQEEGGTKRVSGSISVPTKFWKPEKEIMRRVRKPRSILNARRTPQGLGSRPFIYAGPKMAPGIYARAQRGNTKLRLLFSLVRSAQIKPVLGFFSSGQTVVLKVYQGHFEKRLQQALETARLA